MQITAFGDSITEGVIGIKPEENWLVLLAQKLGDGYTLTNAGVGGNSAREAMMRFDKDVLATNPDLVLLEFGGNNNDVSKPQRIVDDDEFIDILNNFKDRLPEQCGCIMMTFPPIIDEWHAYRKFYDDGKVDCRLEPQRDIVREFARKNNWPLLDLHKLMFRRRYDFILNDGVHFNPAGHAFLAEQMYLMLKH